MNTVARLFELFRPENYQLHVKHQRTERTFVSEVTVTGELVKASDEIRLHAHDLEVAEATVDGTPVTATLRAQDDEVVLQSEQSFAAGKHTLHIVAKGKINDPMHGLYPCYYKHDGADKELLATQFESHHAREVFPCIDEPEAKATFDVTLSTELGVEAIANTPVKTQVQDGNTLVTTFDTTPKMSTYLLAWVIGDLQHKSGKTKDGVEVSVWATKAQKLESFDFALETAIRAIEYYNDFFGVPYPLAKCDLVALPDFSAAAMENWGCITFREACLLVDPLNSSIMTKQLTAQVIIHELAHQWFGNLVTMRWWDDLWLNESFAKLMEAVVGDALFPEWQLWLDFSTGETISALRRDRLLGVQAVRTGVNHPDEIGTLFDPSIVYAKGAKLLQMLFYYIGEDAWKKGLRDYFTKHQYSNTVARDLWNALGSQSDKDAAAFMMPWLERSGYPLVTITQENAQTYKVSQSRFLSNPKDRAADTSAPWPVPLLANTSIEPAMLEGADATIHTTELTTQPLKLNSQDRSFFVTDYATATHRAALKQAVADKKFNEVDRLQLLHELTLLSSAGIVSQKDVLEFLTAYHQEAAYAVWDIMAFTIGDTRKLLEDNEAATDHLRHYVTRLIEQQFKRLGWDKQKDESTFDTLLRGTILGLGSFARYEPVATEGLQRFRAFTSPEELPADLRDIVYIAGIRFGSQAEFDKLMHLYEQTQSSEERENMLSGLTVVEKPEQIQLLLGKLKDPAFVRIQDFPHWFVYLMRNRYSRKAMWQWTKDEWDGWIAQQFGGDKSYDVLPRYAAGAFSTHAEYDEYKAFFTPLLKEPSLRRAIEIGLADIEARMLWRDRDAKAIADFLATQ